MDEFEKLTEQGAGPLAHLLEEAVGLARQAGELTLGYFHSAALDVEQKSDGSPVTQADRQAERLIREELQRRHPGDGILGEEEDEKPSETGRRWIVDPIDGTLAFTHGVGLYSNLLALEDEQGIAVGVINVPALGETVYAARGLGCYCNGVPARVSECDELAESYLTTSSFGEWDETVLLRVRRSGLALRTWGDGYGYALVATGRLDAMADSWAQPYDIAAMPVIISEAGGRFTDWSGAPGFEGGSGLATNGRIHDALLKLLGSSPGR
ncbi:MAG: inositol monophosphatase family protein [Acidimicrobiales bacterium]|jgi:histidinol phosphatase-like enzyme (inositol monophosphatase family)